MDLLAAAMARREAEQLGAAAEQERRASTCFVCGAALKRRERAVCGPCARRHLDARRRCLGCGGALDDRSPIVLHRNPACHARVAERLRVAGARVGVIGPSVTIVTRPR